MKICGATPCACLVHLGIKVPPALLASLERAAGHRRKSEFVRVAIEEKLSRDAQKSNA